MGFVKREESKHCSRLLDQAPARHLCTLMESMSTILQIRSEALSMRASTNPALPVALSVEVSAGVLNQRWEHSHARCYTLGTIAMGQSFRLSRLAVGMAGMRLPSKLGLDRQDLQAVSACCTLNAYLWREGRVPSRTNGIRQY